MDNCKNTLSILKEKVRKFTEERNWSQIHSPKNLAMSISIEAAELMEIFQWKSIEESWKIKEDNREYVHLQEELAEFY